MGIFDALFHKADINTYIAEYKETPGAYLIDVRTGPEYEAGHVEGSINVPLHSIHFIVNHVRDIEAPLYVYCQSGARSGQATSMIKEMGYKNVKNIGGVNRYKGKLTSNVPSVMPDTLSQSIRFRSAPPRHNFHTSFPAATDPESHGSRISPGSGGSARALLRPL